MGKQRVIVCAAIRSPGGGVICGPRHYDHTMHDQIAALFFPDRFLCRSGDDQGFVDNRGVYLTREQALVVAEAADQIIDKHNPKSKLCSEDLY